MRDLLGRLVKKYKYIIWLKQFLQKTWWAEYQFKGGHINIFFCPVTKVYWAGRVHDDKHRADVERGELCSELKIPIACVRVKVKTGEGL